MSATAGSRGPYRRGALRRQEVLETALSVFARHGYRGGSLRMMAERVGINASSLVRLFGSKEKLLEGVLLEWDRRTRALLASELVGLAYLDGLDVLLIEHTRNRGLIELFLTLSAEASDPAHPAHPFLVGRNRAALGSMERHLRIAVSSGEAPGLHADEVPSEARALLAFLDGVELQWLLDPELDMVGLFRRHYARLRQGWVR